MTRRRYWLFVPLLLVGCAAAYIVQLNQRVIAAFESHRAEVPAQVYASALELRPGTPLSVDGLAQELQRLEYRRVAAIRRPGEFSSAADHLDVWLRPAQFADGAVPARYLTVAAPGGVVRSLSEHNQQLEFERFEPLLIGSIYPAQGEDRIVLAPGEVPPLLTAALKVMEDRRFDRHWGVDVVAVIRALWVDTRAGRAEEGASTITQQLVKGFFPSGGRTLGRKVPEALMAMLLELHYSKSEILSAYLNEVPLGQDGDRAIHGFGLAAQFYYGKPLSDLDLAQVAMLVALVRGPTLYDPRHNVLAAIERRNLVLRSLLAQHLVSPEAARAAIAQPLEVLERAAGTYFPDYLDLVHRELASEYSEEDLTAHGLKIFTSLDPRVQEVVQSAAESRTLKSQLQAAIVVTTPATGEVIALLGDRRLGYAGYNRALDARRPIGSLVKPFIYLAALESGRYNATTIVQDAPVTVKIRGHRPWQPVNFTRETYGPVPLVRALAESLNLATVGLGLELGLPTVARSIERFGLNRTPALYPSLLLGSVSLSPFEVAQIYGGLADDGTVVPLRAVQSVLTRDGTPIEAHASAPASVADASAVYQVDRMLQTVMERGTGRGARTVLSSTLTVAGKSGTTSDLRDSWFAGFSGTHLAVVWVGYDDDRPTGLTGSTGALPIWAKVMANLRTAPWNPPMPPSLHDVPIDYLTGMAANTACSSDLLSVAVPVEFTPAAKSGCVLAAAAPAAPASALSTTTTTAPSAAVNATTPDAGHPSLIERIRVWLTGRDRH